MLARPLRILLPILLFSALVLAAGLFVLSRRVNEASSVLAAALSQGLDREVTLGRVRWRPWGQVLVDELVVARWRGLREGYAFRADRVVVTFDPLALFRRRLRVTRLEATRPEIWIEITPEGRSNWDSLLARRGGTSWQSEWSRISMTGGLLTLSDRQRDVFLEGRGLNATLALRSDDTVRGDGQGGIERLVARQGGQAVDIGPLSAKLRWAGSAVTLERLEVARGGARVSASGTLMFAPTFEYALSVDGRDLHEVASLHPVLSPLRTLQLPRVQAVLRGNREKLLLSGLSLETAGGRVAGGGMVRWGAGGPTYELGLRASDLRLARLWPRAGLVATLGGSARFKGSEWNHEGLTAEGTVEFREAGVSGDGHVVSPEIGRRLARLGPIWRGEARFRYQASRLDIVTLGLEGNGNLIRLRGEIRGQSLALRGEATSPNLTVWVPELHGQAFLIGEVTGSFEEPHLAIQLDGRDVRWGDFSLGKVVARAELGRRELLLSSFSIQAEDARMTATGRVAWVPGGSADSLTYEGTGRLEGVDIARLLTLARRQWPVTGRIGGTISVRSLGRGVEGTVDLTMSAGSVWGERIEDGRLRARVEADALWVEQAELRGVGGRLALQGRGTRSSLAGRAEFTELRLGAIRALTKVWPGVDGRGSLRAEVRGTPDEPILEGSWAITDLRRGDAPLGGATGRVAVANQRVSLQAALPAWRSEIQGEVGLGESRPFAVTLRSHGLPVDRLQALLRSSLPSWVAPLEGEISGSARVAGEIARAGASTLEVHLDPIGLLADGQRWENRGPVRVTGSLDRLGISAEFQAGAGSLRVTGTLEPARAWDLRLDGTIPLGLLRGDRLHPAFRGLSGVLRGRLVLRGPWTDPVPSGHFSAEGVRLASGGWPTLERARAEARLVPGQLIVDRIEGTTEDGAFEGGGQIVLRGVTPQTFSLRVGIKDWTLRPAKLLRLTSPGAMEVMTPEAVAAWEEGRIVISGTVEGEGVWARPDGLKFRATFSKIAAETGRLAWTNAGPVRMGLHDGSVQFEPFTMVGAGTRLMLSGRVGPQRQLDLMIAGPVSLTLLEQFPQYVREASGSADIRLRVQGDPDTPRVDGTLTARSVQLQLRRIPEPLVVREGRFRFDGIRLSVDQLSGDWGDGRFIVAGWAERGAGLSLRSLQLTLKGSDLRFRVAGVGQGALDLDLQAEGEGGRPLVRGAVVLRRTVYTRDLQPTAPQRLRGWEDVVAGLPRAIRAMRFDVTLKAPGDVWIRNNLARVEIRGNLSLKGTFAEPLLFGQTEIVRGSVAYRQREFRILAGRVDFLDPRRITPQFNVSAETLAQGVRVLLTLAGRLDHFTVQLASDPPLSREQIHALVAGGAATFVIGESLPGKILKEAGRVAKLDAFQIEPVPEERGVGARVSAGKRVGERLDVTYSRTISASPTQRVSAEYHLTDAISLVGRQDEGGAYSFDVRFSFSFP